MPSINRSNSRAEQKTLSLARTLAALVVTFVAAGASAQVKVWAWDSIDSRYGRNMIKMVDAFPEYKVEDVARRLNALPDGQRVLLLMRYTDRLADHPQDRCRTVDATGKVTLTTFPGPWCAAGEAEVRANVTKLFQSLKAAGVKSIDGLVLDNETTFWAGRYVRADGANTTAIEKDPRFPAIAKRLGFRKLNKLAWGSREYNRWNDVVLPDFDAALTRAVITPFRAIWPKAVICNYGSAPIQSQYMTPDMGGLGITYGGTGFGTHNSLSFYGNSLHWIRGAAFAGTKLNDTPYDMFRMNVHRIRACNASSARKMLPWIANYSLGCNGEGQEPDGNLANYYSSLANSKYWDENVIQLAMHGCDTMLLFNPAAWRRDQNPAIWNKVTDQERCASVIDQINTKLGSTPGVSRWFSLPGLQDRVMATGRRVTGGTMWRFSFAEGVASVTVAMKNGDVREIVPEAGEVGAWVFEADNNPFAAKVDGTDIAYAEAPAGAAWPDLDDSGELDQGDISLLLLDMNEMGSSFDINGDNIVTNADVTAFKTIQKSWYAQATKGRTAMEGSVLVTAAR
jgi:hypothetical protein